MVEAFAAGLPFARRHRLVRDEQIVQPAGAGQADLVGRVEHAGRRAQQLARVVERQRLQEGLRRQPAPAAEQMMQIGGADAGGFRDGVDLGLRAPVARGYGRWRGARCRSRPPRWRAGRGRESGRARARLLPGHGHAGYLGRRGAPSHPISD